MPYLKKLSIFIIIIIFFIFINISGCDKNNNDPDKLIKSSEALQAFAVIQQETDPPTEIITGTTSFSKEYKTNSSTIEITETPTIIIEPEAITEITETTETTEITEDTNAELLYVITPSGKKYHYPTCRTVKTIKQYLTKEEAEQMGYEPCKICNP